MSLDATVWAQEQPIPDPLARLVLLYLADSTGDEYGNLTWDAGDEALIAKATHLSVEQVRWSLDSLMLRGFISRPYVGTSMPGRPKPQRYIRLAMGPEVPA